MVFKKFIGPILHDYHNMDYIPWADKWMEFLHDAYNTLTPEDISSLLDVGVLRATNSSRIAGIAGNVSRYLAGDLALTGGAEDEETESDSE